MSFQIGFVRRSSGMMSAAGSNLDS